MLYSCTHVATVHDKELNLRFNKHVSTHSNVTVLAGDSNNCVTSSVGQQRKQFTCIQKSVQHFELVHAVNEVNNNYSIIKAVVN